MKYMTHGIRGYWENDKVWWLRETAQIGQTFILHRIPINPAILAVSGHRFKAKLKMLMCWSEVVHVETRNQRLFWGLKI